MTVSTAKSAETVEFDKLIQQIRDFAQERDWEQFHSPKNLAMALMVEASELAEIFQWLTQEQSLNLDSDQKQRVEEEVADVMNYLIRICDRLDIDLLEATRRKIRINTEKYPVSQARGSALKYTQYQS
ncbi:MAG: nucleotide pyrophosphohydrolase [Acidiferrobacterales bacterium]|nr:nucleotide pyrophosphohydrolase [Acidiferrobacterales bacterium]